MATSRSGFAILTILAIILPFILGPAALLTESRAAAQAPKRGGTLIIAQDEGPEKIDPHAPNLALQNRVIIVGPYESLLSLDKDFNVQPSLATNWVEESPTSYLFTLRHGVKFHDGSDFTADDVVFTFQRILDPNRPSESSVKMRPISSVTAVDDYTVRFQLKQAFAPFLRFMASPDITGIVARKFTTEHGNDLSSVENGTGPFAITNFQPGVVIEMKRFDKYWKPDRPYLDNVEIRIIPDDSTRIAALRTGDIDMSYFRPDKKPLIDTLKNVTVSKPIFNSVEPISFNCESPPLNDLKVRQAIALTIDKTAIMRTVLPPGLARPSAGIPGADAQFGYQGDGSDFPYPKPDLSRAKQLLAEAGFPNGFPLRFAYINTPAFAVNNRIAEVAREELSQIGVKVTLQPVEFSANFPIQAAGNYQLRSSATTMEADPDGNFANVASASRVNHCKDPITDSLYDEERTELDPAKRRADFDQLQRHLMEDVHFIYLYSDPIRIEVWKSDVKGYQPLPLVRRLSLEETWLDR